MEDLAAIDAWIDSEAISDDIFGFHAQQAVEKFLKAWLLFLGAKSAKKHDLRLLCLLVSEAGADVPDCFTALINLTDFATVFRYEIYDYSASFDRREILNNVQSCADHVRALIFER